MAIHSSKKDNDHFHRATLTFRDHQLETQYRDDYRQNSTDTFLTFAPWAAFTITVGFFPLLIIFDAYLKPLLWLYGLAMAMLLITYWHFRRFPQSYGMLEIQFGFMAVVIGWLDAVLLMHITPFQEFVWAAIGVHIVSSSLALPVRFISAVICQSLVLAGFIIVAVFFGDLPPMTIFIQVLFLNGIASFCFYAVYQREKALRINFLQQDTIAKYSEALNTELEKGRQIQRAFLPTELPAASGYDMATYLQPALQLSGDFFDVFSLPDGRIGVVIADVSDKGVGSALFMALMRSLIRIFSGGWEPESALNEPIERIRVKDTRDIVSHSVSLANDYIAAAHGDEGMFATLCFADIDPPTGTVRYINAGHEPLMIVSRDGVKKKLMPNGPAVGIMSGTAYRTDEISLKSGEFLFGYTDGVTEARSPMDDLYTRKRLERTVTHNPLTSASAFLEAVKKDLLSFIQDAPQSDDITMVAVHRR